MGFFNRHKHDWNLWSKPRNEKWSKRDYWGGIIPQTEFYRIIQDRTCKTCGEYQKRYV